MAWKSKGKTRKRMEVGESEAKANERKAERVSEHTAADLLFASDSLTFSLSLS